MDRTTWSCEIWTCPSEFFMVSVNEMQDSLKSPCIYFVAKIPAGSWETGFHTKPETGFQTKSDGRGGFIGNIVNTYVLFFFCKYLASIYRKYLSILIQRFIFRPWLWLVPWKADMVYELLLSNENILDFTLGDWETKFYFYVKSCITALFWFSSVGTLCTIIYRTSLYLYLYILYNLLYLFPIMTEGGQWK